MAFCMRSSQKRFNWVPHNSGGGVERWTSVLLVIPGEKWLLYRTLEAAREYVCERRQAAPEMIARKEEQRP